jgi:hypothetical protein
MTQEEQRVSIAEACGWKNVAPRIVKNVKHQGDDITVGIWSDNGWIPDYLNDLNAMHEAENTVIKPQRLWYPYCLRLEGRSFQESIGATASQRAEAFLRTIGKWKECK